MEGRGGLPRTGQGGCIGCVHREVVLGWNLVSAASPGSGEKQERGPQPRKEPETDSGRTQQLTDGSGSQPQGWLALTCQPASRMSEGLKSDITDLKK